MLWSYIDCWLHLQVIVATFLIDPKRDISVGFKGDVSGSTMPSPVSASPPVFRPVVESSGGFRVTGMDDHQNMDGNAFMMQSQWRSGFNYDFSGNPLYELELRWILGLPRKRVLGQCYDSVIHYLDSQKSNLTRIQN